MRLVYEDTRIEVKVGDPVVVKDLNYTIESIVKPHKPSSTGLVYLKHLNATGGHNLGYYPSVIRAVWIEREDQKEAPCN